MSEEHLGTLVGVSQQQINRYELGKTGITVDNLIKIAELLGIPMVKFFDDKKIKDAFDEMRDTIVKRKETIDTLQRHPQLITFIKEYSKSATKLKELDLTKLIKKLTSLSPDKRQTILNILTTGKI